MLFDPIFNKNYFVPNLKHFLWSKEDKHDVPSLKIESNCVRLWRAQYKSPLGNPEIYDVINNQERGRAVVCTERLFSLFPIYLFQVKWRRNNFEFTGKIWNSSLRSKPKRSQLWRTRRKRTTVVLEKLKMEFILNCGDLFSLNRHC